MRYLNHNTIRRSLAAALALGGATIVFAPPAHAQWSTAYDQFYLPGNFNWQFRRNYPAADRLFNAFDYGHAILYETLWAKPNAPVSELEEKRYNFITQQLLVNPPRVPLEEAAIEVAYAKLAPEAKLMFDWAHLFHRQVYDVWADESLSPAEKDAKVGELLRYYKSRRDLAFSSQSKTMELMEGQPYSLAFRKNYPKFNGLIWAYHWLQVGLYEPLLVGKTKDERQTGVLATVARFRQMIENPPTNMPRIMPMTAAISPTFAARYPEAAIIFDNLHSMHDVVSDILANPNVPRDQKRTRILEAARRYRDNTSYVQSAQEWRDMAQMMGVENMGGPVIGFLAGFPAPTVERGAVMAGMDHAKMPGMRMADSSAKDSSRKMDHSKMDHAKMATPGMRDSTMRDSSRARADSLGVMDHSKMQMPAEHPRMSDQMMDMHMRMMADPVIRKRIVADTAMRRMMTEMIDQMPVEHRDLMKEMMREEMTKPSATGTKKPAAAKPRAAADKPAAKKPATTTKKPVPKDSMPGMDHSKMPGMKMPPAKKP
jgi:hypothetical protein